MESLYSFRLPPALSYFRNLSITALKETKLRHVVSINTEKNLLDRSLETCQSHFCSFCQLLETTLEIIWSVCSTMPNFTSLLHSEFFQNHDQWASSQSSVQPSVVNLCMTGLQGNQHIMLSINSIICLSKCTCKQCKSISISMFPPKGMCICKGQLRFCVYLWRQVHASPHKEYRYISASFKKILHLKQSVLRHDFPL